MAPESVAMRFAAEKTTLWTTELLAQWLTQQENKPTNARAAQRRMTQWGWYPNVSTQKGAICSGTHTASNKELYILWASTPRGELMWMNLASAPTDQDYCDFASVLLDKFEEGYALALSFAGAQFTPQFSKWLQTHPKVKLLAPTAPTTPAKKANTMKPSIQSNKQSAVLTPDANRLTHLQRLEAESIHIMREVVATCDNPVMLYSIGKDSAVMLHLALKAFHPAKLPFPLLHVDTGWKFKDMYAFRDRMQNEHDFQLLVHQNPEGVAMGINPFTHGSQIHTDIMKTQGLKQALDHYQFDAAFGGARRDEEKSRAKERIFSFRSAQHRWDPKNQRPELWNLYNTHKNKGESLRVFPISNWTELDIWQYIHLENIPIVPLYFSQERPVVERDGSLIMVDDERMPLKPGEVPMLKKVRFRTLGCYPLTGAVESEADTLPNIIQEMLLTKTSERQGRVIDHDAAASMEKKKQEGYF
jgi:sulfate adenylyltransferase subunit 2